MTYWLEFSTDPIENASGLKKRSLIHADHVLICSIDNNGTVRGEQVIEIEFNPMQLLVEDVAQGFHYLNSEKGNPLIIDFYTSNDSLKQFIQSIIIKMFEQSTSKRIEDRFKFTVTTHENRTTLHSDRIHLSVGPYTKPEFDCKNPIKGIVLDIVEAEKRKLDIESTMSDYTWAAVLVPKEKHEGYFHALSSLFREKGQPFFVETLNNQTLKELFDFIFAVTMEKY